MHNIRCEMAEGSVCRCSCHGDLHGILFRTLKKKEEFMAPPMGGEVAEIVQALKGKSLTMPCGLEMKIMVIVGYLDKNGIADKNGNTWAMYVRCRFLIDGQCLKSRTSPTGHAGCKPTIIVPGSSGMHVKKPLSPTELKIICFLLP